MLLLLLAALESPPPAMTAIDAMSDDEAVFELRRRATEEPRAAIPEARFSVENTAAAESCRFYRLGPGPGGLIETQLRFVRAVGSARRDGFAVDVKLEGGTAPQLPPLWYSRGHLLGTTTLPPLTGNAKERPGTREEYVVITYLPKTHELLAEWQRQAGPSPKESDLASLPHALLVEKGIVYSSYLRASAYMLCRSAPREPVPEGGSSRTSPGPGGTRQPGP